MVLPFEFCLGIFVGVSPLFLSAYVFTRYFVTLDWEMEIEEAGIAFMLLMIFNIGMSTLMMGYVTHLYLSLIKDGFGIDPYLPIRRLFRYLISKGKISLKVKSVTISIGQLPWAILAFVLALISTGGGWNHNPTTVNLSGVGNAVISFLRGFADAISNSNLHTPERVISGDIFVQVARLEADQDPSTRRSFLARRLAQARRKGTGIQWTLTILAFALGAVSTGGGWKNNSSLVNISGVGAVLVPIGTFFFGTNQHINGRRAFSH
ncbi:hypothetical protein GYMLUDRAFT_77717 [Collybiopsis luxurians FD-317 M1]|uniref:Transmembrane protein n=1 Tax=Collybiopsis luxurians FD-317 M1 TaxID=944289 RepID=A0A0D0CCQ6_9AGAR|nr:hypothetical protein GYMLUDRAFT_77717 [Collybiopsis luxurians FD-317 M1]